MTAEDRMEAVSRAYLQAVAAACGLTFSVRSSDYGIDLTLHEVVRQGRNYVETETALDIQLKSTTRATLVGGEVRYDLDRRAFNVLRADNAIPRVLLVLALPRGAAGVLVGRSRLRIEGAMYWLSLAGRPPIRNRRSVRVRIPRRQLFTVRELQRKMASIRDTGATP